MTVSRRSLLKSFVAPILTWYVDSKYMQNRGQTVTTMNESDPLGGLHAQTALAITPEGRVELDNWWRHDTDEIYWGTLDGTCLVDPALIERMNSVRIFALKNAPLVKGKQ